MHSRLPLTAPAAPAPRISYSAVLGSSYVARLLGGALTGRLPNSIAPVTIVLWAFTVGRGVAFGGLPSALYGLAASLSQSAKGRINGPLRAKCRPPASSGPQLQPADRPAARRTSERIGTRHNRRRRRRTDRSAPGRRASRAVAQRPARLRLRHAALALDTGTQGLLYIVGPLLAAALASAHRPAAALAIATVLGLAGTLIVVTAPPSRRWRPHRRPMAQVRHSNWPTHSWPACSPHWPVSDSRSVP